MSTILDALKRVEEQLRYEAEQKAAGVSPGEPGPSKAPVPPAGPLRGISLDENDDAAEVYLRLVDMLTRIQNRNQAAVDEGRAEARSAHAALTQTVVALRNDLAQQVEALRRETQQRETQHKNGNAAFGMMQAQGDTLKKLLDEARGAYTELAKAVTGLQKDLSQLNAALQKEVKQRDVQQDAGNAAAKAMQSQTDALKKLAEKNQTAIAELAKSLAALQSDFTRQGTAFQKEVKQRDTERAAADTAAASMRSQIDAQAKLLEETRKHVAAMVKPVNALQNEFLRQDSAFQKETQRRDAQNDTFNTALAAVKSDTDSLKKYLADTRKTLAEVAKPVNALQGESIRQDMAFKKEIQKRDAERETADAALAAAQSDNNALKQHLAETRRSHSELAQALAALQNDFMRQKEAVQKELQQKNAEREAVTAALTETRSQVEFLKKLLAETKGSNAALTQALAALQNDSARQREAVQAGFQKHEAEREAAEAALAAMQSEIDSLKQSPAGGESTVPKKQKKAVPVAGVAESVSAEVEKPHVADETADAETKPKARMDKNEALKLHGDARTAYADGDFAVALQLLDMIDAAFPGNSSVLHNRAQCLIALDRNDEARTLCDYLITNLNHTPAIELRSQIKD